MFESLLGVVVALKISSSSAKFELSKNFSLLLGPENWSTHERSQEPAKNLLALSQQEGTSKKKLVASLTFLLFLKIHYKKREQQEETRALNESKNTSEQQTSESNKYPK